MRLCSPRPLFIGVYWRSARNSSTVIPAWRMRARRVPTDSSLCWGIERLTRSPGFVITRWLPTCPAVLQPAFSKARTASLPEILASRATGLDGDEDFALPRLAVTGDGLLILRPEPCGDGFLDIGQCLLFGFPLRHASGQRRTFGHNPAVLRIGERYMEDHAHILASVPHRYNACAAPRTKVMDIRSFRALTESSLRTPVESHRFRHPTICILPVDSVPCCCRQSLLRRKSTYRMSFRRLTEPGGFCRAAAKLRAS